MEISATGYRNQGGRTFAGTPDWQGSVRVLLPDVIDVLRNPGDLLEKFEEAASRFRPVVRGDFDGKGQPDVAMLSREGDRVEVWWVGDGGSLVDESGIAELFFGGGNKTLTVEQVLGWLGDVAERRVQALTGGRKPDLRIPFGSSGDGRLRGLESGDFDGDGRDELLLISTRPGRADFRVLPATR